jgi:hypothetical protein
MKAVRLVQPSNDWTELEERRRLFWIVFLLDRFCSISTGWNTSLTAEDVHRRLPADGAYFTREEPVTTPYFGIWNKAAARIGRSLANVPAQYNEDDPSIETCSGTSPSSANGYIDASKLGAFAYCVEATESLSQVTTFFLQQRINWQDKEHAINWLTRFKELDLRLVHWKIFLPPKWKDSDISADQAVVDMDPNLTLAHITHNTSMILLHHPIAFPPPCWHNYIALPKECSAQTCELAAIETSNIVDKFLIHSPIPFVNAQFAFCAFVAAKALLFDHQRTRRTLRPGFQRLVCNLWTMSNKWIGEKNGVKPPNPQVNQAGIYARLLEHLHNDQIMFDMFDHSCQSPDTQQYVSQSPVLVATPYKHSVESTQKHISANHHSPYHGTNGIDPAMSPRYIRSSSMMTGITQGQPNGEASHRKVMHTNATGSHPFSLPPHETPIAADRFAESSQTLYGLSAGAIATPSTTTHRALDRSMQNDSLLTLSDAFMNADYLDLDRVITFEDANFFIPWQ